MADSDVWGLGGPIASPAATDRAPWATGPVAGGYSLRGDFVWKNSAGSYLCGGPLGIGTAAPNAKLEIEGTGGLGEIRLTETAQRTWQIRAGGTVLGGFEIADATAGFSRFQIVGAVGHVRPGTDNAQDLGDPALRWAVVRAGTGTISTSDRDDKRDIGDIPDAWLDAWADVEWCRFKFIGGSRWHVGLVAQQVHESFAAHDIDAFDIGLCCWDEWPAVEAVEQVLDQDGSVLIPAKPAREAGSRWALRYDECEAMEAAYQRREIARMKERLAELDAA